MNKTYRNILCLLLCMVLLVACEKRPEILQLSPSASPVNGAEDEGYGITAALGKWPKSLDPAQVSDGGTLSYLAHLYEGLFRYAADGKSVEYGVAQSVSVKEDGLVWTLRLREDATWSDGAPVVAGDFVYAFRRLVNPSTNAPYGYDIGCYFENGEAIALGEMDAKRLGVEALDDHTLEIHLSRPCGWFDEVLAHPSLSPVREDMAVKDGFMQDAEASASNGRYVLESFDDTQIVLSKREDAQGKEEPQTLQFVYEGGATVGLQSGAIQLAAGSHEGVEGVETCKLPMNGSLYLVFNQAGEGLRDENLRKALALAANPAGVAEEMNAAGHLVEPAYALFGEGFVAFDGTDYLKEGGAHLDQARARREAQAAEAFAQAEFNEEKPLQLLCYEDEKQHILAQSLASAWKGALGIEVEAVFVSWEEYLDLFFAGEYDMAFWFWALEFSSPVIALEYFASDSPYNTFGFYSEKFDGYVQQARPLGLHAKAGRDAMHKAEALLMDGFAIAPLIHYRQVFTVSKGLSGYGITPSGIVLLHGAQPMEE